MIALHWLYEQRATPEMLTAWRPDDPAAKTMTVGVSLGGWTHCWLCGLACPVGAPSQPVEKAIPETFTEYRVARAPQSQWACPACAAYFVGVKPLVSYSHRITPTICQQWMRDTMRSDLEALLYRATGTPLLEPVVLAIISSPTRRRHVLPHAPATYSSQAVAVQFEQHTVYVTAQDWRAVTTPYDQLRQWGHSKTEILTGNWHPVALKRDVEAGRLDAALMAMEAIRPWRGGPLLDLVAYVSPGGILAAENENEETTHDGDSANDRDLRHAGIGAGGRRPTSGLRRHQPGVPQQISPGNLDATAKSGGGARADDQPSSDVRQPTLWGV